MVVRQYIPQHTPECRQLLQFHQVVFLPCELEQKANTSVVQQVNQKWNHGHPVQQWYQRQNNGFWCGQPTMWHSHSATQDSLLVKICPCQIQAHNSTYTYDSHQATEQAMIAMCMQYNMHRRFTVEMKILIISRSATWMLHAYLSTWVAHITHCCQLYIHTHTHTRLMALFPGLPGWACTRKVKPIWILLKQETVSGSGISWAICKSAPCSRQITTPVTHHSVFYRPDALPADQPTVSKHWRDYSCT